MTARTVLALSLTFLSVIACGGAARTTKAKAPAHFGKATGAPDTSAWLGPKSRGSAEVLVVEGGVAGDRVTTLLEIPDAECAIAIARATPSVDDLDLFAYGEDGAVLGSDEGSDKTPSLLICPPHPRRVMLLARIAAGHGLVAIGAQRVDVRDAERAAATYGVRYRPGEVARRLTVWPGLEERIDAYRRQLGGEWVDVRRVPVPLDARTPTRLSAPIEADRCLHVLASPSDEVSGLDMTLLDPDGRILGRADAVGRDRSVVVCSPTPVAVTLELRPHGGVGLAVVMMSRSREGTETEIDRAVLRFSVFATAGVAEERGQLAARLSRAGYGEGRVLTSGTLPLGRRTSTELTLPTGCSRLDWVSGAPLRGVRAWVYSPDGALLASDEGARPILVVCGKGGKVRLDAESLARPGPFAVELRQERNTPKLLEDQTLAAGRLIRRMLERGVIDTGRRVGAVYVHPLSPAAVARQKLTLPIGRCLDATLAIGPGAEGAELRFVGSDGAELALARGDTATSTRVCSNDSETNDSPEVTAELRVLAGTATGLLTAHLTDLGPRSPGPRR
jgi:hypothetical protein